MSRFLLAGDIGGTKTNIALYAGEGERWAPVREASVRSADYPHIFDLFAAFLGQPAVAVDVVSIGVAGPVRGGRVETPNLPWVVDAEEIGKHLGAPRVLLLNDLLATAYGIGELPPERFAVLQEGREDPQGNGAVIAAGTGLGEALLFRGGGTRFLPAPSEGGHASFAPTSELEADLLGFLAAELGHVSVERIVSGRGLRNVYRFFTATGREAESPRVRERMAQEDVAAVISEEGLAGRDAACARALDLWVRAYGSQAGNLALTALATGGLWVGGGIAPKILPKLREGAFLQAFLDKGRLAKVLAEVPVRVLLDPKTALYGAVAFAAARGEHGQKPPT